MLLTLFPDLYSITPSFTELKSHLTDKGVVSKTNRFIHRISHLCATPQNPLQTTIRTRVFLAGYLVKYRHEIAFRNMEHLEITLLGAAHSLITCTDIMVSHLTTAGPFSSMSRTLVESFPTLLTQYHDAYDSWNSADQAEMSVRVRSMLKVLYHAERELPASEPQNSRLRTEFNTQVTRLRVIFLRISGENALSRFDAEIVAEMTDVVAGLLDVIDVAQNGGAAGVA